MRIHLTHLPDRTEVTVNGVPICEVEPDTTGAEYRQMFEAFSKVFTLGYTEGQKDKNNETKLQTQ